MQISEKLKLKLTWLYTSDFIGFRASIYNNLKIIIIINIIDTHFINWPVQYFFSNLIFYIFKFDNISCNNQKLCFSNLKFLIRIKLIFIK